MTGISAPAHTREPKWWNTPAALLGGLAGLLLGIAWLIGQQRYGPGGQYSLSQANGFCSSAFGQLGQIANARASANCSSVATMEQWRGWLTVAGIVVLLGGAGWYLRLWLQARSR